MSLKEQLVTIRGRAERASEIQTEEATKNALVMPMLRALGYDVFDPAIVVPEFTADFGTKKGEKVDYAIRIGGEVQILIECKPITAVLATAHASQLYRYFSVTKARFGILTNGREWRFFTDLDIPNKMDEQPFFIFSVVEYGDQDLTELEKFAAANFSVDGIISAASDLKLKSLITEALRREFMTPSDEFARMIGKRVMTGAITADVRTRLSNLIVSCVTDILRDQANQRLKDAIDRPSALLPAGSVVSATLPAPPVPETLASADPVRTTDEERDAFRIIQAILRKDIDVKRVAARDNASYCAILFDDNNRKPIARLYLEGKNKRIGIFENKAETRHDIGAIEDIYRYSDEIQASVKSYLTSVG
jgi:hypothetical protein